MAALLVICVPILFALVADVRERSKNAKTRSAILLLAAGGIAVIGFGIVLNGSIAVLLLGPPVLLVSATMLLARKTGVRKPLVALAALGTAAMLVVYMSPLHDRIAGDGLTSIEERREMWANTSAAIPQFLPFGSGVSSFPTLYPRYEDMATVTRTYTNHAHNDYLELALETGIPGVLLLIAFLWWWAARTRSIWRPVTPDPYAQAATIVTAALLLHSIVDYPLRTGALSAVMAAFVAIMARPRESKQGAEADLWPTRHAKI
jgi:O-antigen ligase